MIPNGCICYCYYFRCRLSVVTQFNDVLLSGELVHIAKWVHTILRLVITDLACLFLKYYSFDRLADMAYTDYFHS